MKGLFHILAVLAFLSGKSWSQEDIELALEEQIIQETVAEEDTEDYVVEDIIVAEHMEPMGPDTLPPADEEPGDEEPGDEVNEAEDADDVEIALEAMIIPDEPTDNAADGEDDEEYYVVEDLIVAEHVEPLGGDTLPPAEEPSKETQAEVDIDNAELALEDMIITDYEENVKEDTAEEEEEEEYITEEIVVPEYVQPVGKSSQQQEEEPEYVAEDIIIPEYVEPMAKAKSAKIEDRSASEHIVVSKEAVSASSGQSLRQFLDIMLASSILVVFTVQLM